MAREHAETVAVYNWQWGRDIDVPKAFHDRMQSHGFTPWHTGGGCMAWVRDLDDDDYLMITYGDVELGGPRQARERDWYIGRYNNRHSGFVGCVLRPNGSLTLREALTVADGDMLPSPKDENDQRYFGWAGGKLTALECMT